MSPLAKVYRLGGFYKQEHVGWTVFPPSLFFWLLQPINHFESFYDLPTAHREDARLGPGIVLADPESGGLTYHALCYGRITAALAAVLLLALLVALLAPPPPPEREPTGPPRIERVYRPLAPAGIFAALC